MGSWSSVGLVVVASAHNYTSFNFELALPFGQSDLFPDLAVSQSKTDAALSNLSSTLLASTHGSNYNQFGDVERREELAWGPTLQIVKEGIKKGAAQPVEEK
jgi:hypothetical protein